DVPTVPRLIEDYRAGGIRKEHFVAGLAQAFRREVTKIPRKGARGGHEHVPTPDIQMEWLIDEILTIVESAKSARSSPNLLDKKKRDATLPLSPDPHRK